MINDVEYKGYWYLPTKPRRKIRGTLRFTPAEGSQLDLDGTLKPNRDVETLFEMFDPPIILGVSDSGEAITLRNCFQTGMKGSQSSFSARFAFIGEHFKTEADLNFKEIRVQYQHLDEWSGVTGFKVEVKHQKPRGVNVNYTEQEPVILVKNDDYSISIDTKWSVIFPGKESRVSQDVYATMEFQEQRPFDDCLAFARVFQNLLTISIMKPPFPLLVEVRKDKRKVRTGRVIKKAIKVYYEPVHNYENKSISRHKMLFTLKDVRASSNAIIENWFARSGSLDSVFNLYFANLYRPSIYTENKFLNLTQAIETYHRRVYGGKYQADEKYLSDLYQKFLSIIPEDIDRDFERSLVQGKLRYANEFSLRKRLGELVKTLRPCLPDNFLQSSKECYAFIGKVTDTRNYLTHYDESAKEKAAQKLELSGLEHKLRLILEASLLRELGFDDSKIREMLSISETYRTIKALED